MFSVTSEARSKRVFPDRAAEGRAARPIAGEPTVSGRWSTAARPPTPATIAPPRRHSSNPHRRAAPTMRRQTPTTRDRATPRRRPGHEKQFGRSRRRRQAGFGRQCRRQQASRPAVPGEVRRPRKPASRNRPKSPLPTKLPSRCLDGSCRHNAAAATPPATTPIAVAVAIPVTVASDGCSRCNADIRRCHGAACDCSGGHRSQLSGRRRTGAVSTAQIKIDSERRDSGIRASEMPPHRRHRSGGGDCKDRRSSGGKRGGRHARQATGNADRFSRHDGNATQRR